MKSSISFISLAITAVVTLFLATSEHAVNAKSFATPASLFGVRGGGLFGGKDDKATGDVATAEKTDLPKFPAMSDEEVEEFLAHIPVFAVTDENGAGVVLKPDDETSVFYFFMSPQMANATLTQLQSSNSELKLQISAFSLGKIWFKILNADENAEVKLKAPGAADDAATTSTKGVEYRLVPDTRDLLGARMLLTMDPEDGEALKNGGSLTPEMAQAAIKKAMTGSPKFNSTFNEIPVFMIQQMRMQKQNADGTGPDETAQTILPMYFNLQNMVALWQQFVSQTPEAGGVEPAINLMDLFELVKKMQEESEIDFRNVVLIPSTPMGGGAPGAAAASASASAGQGDEPFKMPGASTLGDL